MMLPYQTADPNFATLPIMLMNGVTSDTGAFPFPALVLGDAHVQLQDF